MTKGKIKYNWGRPISIGFFLLISALGFYGMYLWLLSGGLPLLFDTGDGADVFPKILAMMFAGIGCVATVSIYLTGIVETRTDKIALTEIYCKEYTNGVLVAWEDFAKFYTDNHKQILKRGYVFIRHIYYKNGKSHWIILGN